MDVLPGLLRYGFVALAWIAGVEWLLGRAISRLAAAPNLEGPPRTLVEILGGVGLFLLAPASLLAVGLLFLSVSAAGGRALEAGNHRRVALLLYLGIFGAVSAAYVILPTAPWITIGYACMSIVAYAWVALAYGAKRTESHAMRAGVLLVVGAYTGYLLYLLIQGLERAGYQIGVSGVLMRDLGEVAVVSAPFAFFAALSVPFKQWFSPTRWIVPVIITLALSAANVADLIADQGFTGVFAIWSIGLSYFLPWPLYAISLALYLYSILTCLSNGARSSLATRDRAIGMLLLAFASYELFFPYQYVLALLSILLLSGIVAPFGSTGPLVVGSMDETLGTKPVPRGLRTGPHEDKHISRTA